MSYARGQGAPQDYVEAAKWYRKAAVQGDAKAQCNLGMSYLSGRGVAQSAKFAVDWFRKAADQGDARAENYLGVSYARGDGVQQDYGEAAKWYRKAAEQGDAKAQCNLGVQYAKGQGVSQDYVEAAKWYRRAAKQGGAAAQFDLGLMHQQGRGVPRDYVEAYKWFDLSIAQAKPADCLKLQMIVGTAEGRLATISGVTLGRGEDGFAKTAVGEVKIRCIAVEENSADMLVEGEAQPRTLEMASKGKPSDMYQAAIRLRASLEGRMTKDQITEGQKRASVFVAKKEDAASGGEDSMPKPENVEGMVATGTAFFVTDDGYLVTCAHVVRGATSFHIKTASGSLPARLVRQDSAMDLALLKVSGTFQALPLTPSPQVKLGDSVFTIGFPNTDLQGVAPKLTRGEISSLAGIRDNPRCFQISVPVQPGNSGGALVDEHGNVVGVVVARLDDVVTYEASGALPQNVNYAVKGGLVYSFLSRVPELVGKLKPMHTAADQGAANAAAERAAVLVIAE